MLFIKGLEAACFCGSLQIFPRQLRILELVQGLFQVQRDFAVFLRQFVDIAFFASYATFCSLQLLRFQAMVPDGVHHIVIAERGEIEDGDDIQIRHGGEIIHAPLHVSGIRLGLIETVMPGQIDALLEMGLQIISIRELSPISVRKLLNLHIHADTQILRRRCRKGMQDTAGGQTTYRNRDTVNRKMVKNPGALIFSCNQNKIMIYYPQQQRRCVSSPHGSPPQEKDVLAGSIRRDVYANFSIGASCEKLSRMYSLH